MLSDEIGEKIPSLYRNSVLTVEIRYGYLR